MANENIDIRIREDGSVVVSRQIENVGKAGTRAATGIDMLKRALAGLSIAIVAREFMRMLDVTTQIDNRLRLVTNTTGELNAVYDELLRISNTTRTGLEANAEIFNRLSIATQGLGLTYREQLDLTEQLNKALIISGVSAEEGAAALRQLGQALGTGALKSDEFVSVNENLPRVMQAIADEMGVPRGALKQLAEEGKITAQVIVDAMSNASGALNEEFSKITPTISGAFTVLNNQLLNFVRNVNTSSGIGEILANVILFVADNINVLIGVAAGLAVVMVGALIPGIIAMGAAFAATPLGWVTVGLAGILALVGAFGDKQVEVAGQTVTVWQIIKATIATVVDVVSAVYEAVSGLFSNMTTSASPFFSTVGGWISDFAQWWLDMTVLVAEYVKAGINMYIGLYVGLISAVGPVITQGIPAIFKLAIALASNFVVDGVENIINIFARGLGAIGSALDSIPGFEGTGAGITAALSVDLQDLKMDTAGYTAEVKNAGAAISEAFGAAQQDYVGQLGGVIEGVANTIGDTFNANLQDQVEITNQSQTAAEILAGTYGTTPDSGLAGAAGNAAGGAAKLSDVMEAQKSILEGVNKEAKDFATNIAAATALVQSGQITGLQGFAAVRDSGNLSADLFAGSEEARQLEIQGFQAMYAQIDAMRQADLISERTAMQARLAVDAQYNEMRLEGASAVFGELANLSRSSNRTIAAIGKAAAVTQATIDGVLAVQKALASYPPPMNYALAAAIGATTAANIASILSTNTNFATGGSFVVPGSGGTDSALVGLRASPGERVTVQTPEQVRKGSAAPGMGGGGQAPAPVVNAKIVNVIDPALVGDYLATPDGEQLIMNVIRRNGDQVKQVANG